MKKPLFFIACLAVGLASCHSPEERAAMKAAADSSENMTHAAVGPAETTDTTTQVSTAVDTPVVAPKAVDPKTDAPVVTAAPVTPPPAEKPKELPGEGLVKKSDCLACHNVSQKIVGPAYKNVAAKYEANDENIDMLADKIINGGSGVWGAVPMSPHPSISKADAKEMVKYILSLKK